MSALTALSGSSRSSQIPGASDSNGQDNANGQDFASMMSSDTQNASTPKPKVAQRAQDKASSQPDKSTAPKPSDNAPDQDKSTEQARSTQAGGRQANETAKTAAKEPAGKDAKDTKQEDDSDDAWPPTGLAGFGMAVLPVVTTVLPGAVTAPLAAAGLAVGLAGAAGKAIAGMLGGDSALPGAAATAEAAAQPATATTGASAAVANGGFTGLLAQAATAATTKAAGTGSAPMAALAAMAGMGDTKHDDPSTTAGADPISALATTSASAPLARATDSSAPFSASPTPTPNLHSDNFDEALGARMSWLADQKIGHAHIKINPAELGPVEVRLHLNGDQVNASFSSAQADVRQALENSLPRLREMLGQHGFQLGQADVGQQQQQASQGGGQQSSGNSSGNPLTDELQGAVGIPAVTWRQRGLLDAYA